MSIGKALCLNMIVKNEMANLERCLSSVAPYIACWVIGDTGSTDGTQDYIRAFFAERGIPGELHEFPFVDFGQARNEALDRARASGLAFDYLLFTDADMELTVDDPAFAQKLSAAAYKVLQRSGVAYWNNRLLGRDTPASYKGVTHEFLDVREGETLNLEGVSYIDHATGSNRVEKYDRDIRLLKAAIAAEADPGMLARYTFYLANTYRDSGRREEALEAYLERTKLGHWREEVIVSLLNVARLKEALERPDEEVLAAYRSAMAEGPGRAEALHDAARFCRNRRLFEQGYQFATQGLAIPRPQDALFVHDWIYDYGLLDELAVNAYWTERYTECIEACDRLLAEEKIPAASRGRVQDNKNHALGKLKAAATATPAERQTQGHPMTGSAGASLALEDFFLELAPFLRAAESPGDRREQSRAFDAKIASLLDHNGSALPQINCFYEVLDENARHGALIAATSSMRAAGHPVRVWSYSPQKLEFLRPHGVELRDASDVVPRGLFERVMGGSEVRYFSDIFRYAVLYEHGGLWMDTDVVLLRPFPFRGDHFFNLQWRPASKREHFVCGNVIYAERHSRHMRALYEMSIERFFSAQGQGFGDVGPKLLSDYIASDAGTDLRKRVFSPVFFNSIDWVEIDQFDHPIGDLADYLNDERVFGVHLWNARNNPDGRDRDTLISTLSELPAGGPGLTALADRFNTDKNRHSGNRHCYARVYDQLLASRRLSMKRLMEIGLCRGLAEGNQSETPSVQMWQTYFPFAQVVGVDLTDFSALNNDRFTSFVCDQSSLEALRATAAKLEPGSFDVIIDDGSHASYDQQLTLREFFPLLADGGWYFVEDLDWQPPGEDADQITLTKTLLREIQDTGAAQSLDPMGVSALADQFAEILVFDSHYELTRARLLGGVIGIRKRGGSGLVL